MIKINLLPMELRKAHTNALRIPYAPFAILAGMLFLLMTFFFYADYLAARSAYNNVRQEWTKLNPSMAQLKTLETRIEVEMKGEKDFLEKKVLNTESLTRILSWVSEFLPSKAWLTGLKAERTAEGVRLNLRGVVLASRTQTGIEQIEEYFQKLKMKLSPQAAITLMTSKDIKEKTSGTAFDANLEWGVTSKP